MIADLAHQQRANLHLNHITEPLGMQERIFPSILLVDRQIIVRHRIHGMKASFDPVHLRLIPRCRIYIAMIIRHRQPQDIDIAALKPICQLPRVQKRTECILSMLDGKIGILKDRKNLRPAVTGTDQRIFIRIDRAQPLGHLPREKIIEGHILAIRKIAHIDMLPPDKPLHQMS